jgi:hypothetical protein
MSKDSSSARKGPMTNWLHHNRQSKGAQNGSALIVKYSFERRMSRIRLINAQYEPQEGRETLKKRMEEHSHSVGANSTCWHISTRKEIHVSTFTPR